MGLINTRNTILTPDCKSLLTCYICLCVPTIRGSCQPKPFWVSLPPVAPGTDVSRVVTTCTVHNTHKHRPTHEPHPLSPAWSGEDWGHNAGRTWHYCQCRTTSKTGLKFPSQKETVSLLWKCEVWHKICYIQVTKSILLYGAVWCAVGLEGLLCLFSHKKSWSFHHQSILSLSLHNCAVNLTGLQRLYLKSFSKAWF